MMYALEYRLMRMSNEDLGVSAQFSIIDHS